MKVKNLLRGRKYEVLVHERLKISRDPHICSYVGKCVTSDITILMRTLYLALRGIYHHVPNLPRDRTSPGLPYCSHFQQRHDVAESSQNLLWRSTV